MNREPPLPVIAGTMLIDSIYPMGPTESHRKFCHLIAASSAGGLVERDDPADKYLSLSFASDVGSDAHVAGLDAPVTDFDACATDLDACATDFDALIGSESSVTEFDAFIGPDHSVMDSYISDHQRDLKNIADGLLTLPPSASLGSFPAAD